MKKTATLLMVVIYIMTTTFCGFERNLTVSAAPDANIEKNVSSGKSVLSVSNGTTEDVAKVNDGDLGTYWGLTGNAPAYYSPKWFIIDLGAPYLLSRLECELNYNTVYDHLRGTYFYASNDPTVPASSREQLTQVPSDWSGPSPWSATVSPTSSYRYIMLYKPSGDIMLKEFMAYANYVNVSLGKTATSSSNAGASYTPNMAVDGNVGTSFMQSTNVWPSWWQVDLGLPYQLSQIEIEKMYDSNLDSYRNNFKILASNDYSFATFAEIASQDNTSYTTNTWNAIITNTTQYRYVRFLKTSDNAAFSEFRVLVDSANIYTEENISTGKNITSVSYGTTADATKVNDNDLNTYWALTGNAPTYYSPKWLIMDLGAPYLISRLDCVLNYANVYDHIRGTYFYASNDPTVPPSSREQLTQVPLNWSGSSPWSEYVSTTSSYRYIMLYKPSGDIMLKDFGVYTKIATPKVTGVDFPITTDVAAGKEISVNFNTNITQSTINNSNIQLTNMSNNQGVSFSVSKYMGNGFKLLLPQMENNNTYKLTLGTGITNVKGTAMSRTYVNSFTTHKSYEASNIEFTDNLDGTGQPLVMLTPLAQVSAKVNYKNYSSVSKDVMLVIAFKKGDAMVISKMDNKTVVPGQNINLIAGLTTPNNITGLTATSYIWDYNSLQPYADKNLLDSASLPLAQAVFYVSSLNGMDTNLGTHAAPFATIKKAQQAVRAVNSNMIGDIYVYIENGRYELSNTLTFGRADSGTNGYNIFYAAYPGHTPVISGGKSVNKSGWQQYSGNIYKTTISDNIADIRELYVNGKRKIRARSELTINAIASYYEDGIITGIRVDDKALPVISNPRLAEIVWPTIEWRTVRLPVSDIIADNKNSDTIVKPTKNILDVVRSYFGSVDTKYPFYVENAIELLNNPGEFFYNRETKELYYMPEVGENIYSSEIYFPNIFKMIDIKGDSLGMGVHNITFNGLTFEHNAWTSPSTDGYIGWQAQYIRAPMTQVEFSENQWRNYFMPGAIRLEWADNINFTNNKLRHISTVGFSLMEKVENCLFEGNSISDISDSAISIGHSNQSDAVGRVCKNIIVRNNVISDIGVGNYGAPGIQTYYTDSVTIDHNIVANVPYTGIGQGWGWNGSNTTMRNNAITNNFIYNTMMTNLDGGGIYTLGTQSTYGSVISGNYIKNQGKNAAAIYNDEGSKYYTITNNVSENVYGWLLHWTPTIQNITASNNYSTTTSNFGGIKSTNSSIEDVKCYPNANWPQDALNIITNAGLQPKYSALADGVIYSGANSAPIIDDSSCQALSVVQYKPITIPVKISDDKRPYGYLNTSWLAYDGPAGTVYQDDYGVKYTNAALINNKAASIPTVSFGVVGTYKLQLTVSDGQYKVYKYIPVTVTAAASGTNIAKGMVTTASSTKSGSNLTYAVDGSSSTMWESAGDGVAKQWLTVDLGSAKSMSRVEFVTKQSEGVPFNYRYNFEIELSNDPTFATYVVEGIANSDVLNIYTTWFTMVKSSTAYRYVRIKKTDGWDLGVAELRVYQ